jgi:hypothetical protein
MAHYFALPHRSVLHFNIGVAADCQLSSLPCPRCPPWLLAGVPGHGCTALRVRFPKFSPSMQPRRHAGGRQSLAWDAPLTTRLDRALEPPSPNESTFHNIPGSLQSSLYTLTRCNLTHNLKPAYVGLRHPVLAAQTHIVLIPSGPQGVPPCSGPKFTTEGASANEAKEPLHPLARPFAPLHFRPVPPDPAENPELRTGHGPVFFPVHMGWPAHRPLVVASRPLLTCPPLRLLLCLTLPESHIIAFIPGGSALQFHLPRLLYSVASKESGTVVTVATCYYCPLGSPAALSHSLAPLIPFLFGDLAAYHGFCIFYFG